jgi:hypothetical protein
MSVAQTVRQHRPRRAAKSGSAKPRVIGPFSLIAEKLIIVAAIAGGGAFLYLVYGLISGPVTSFPHPAGAEKSILSDTAQATLKSWVGLATQILGWSAFLGSMLAMARYYDSSSSIWAAGAVGGALYVGLPALIAMVLSHQYRSANDLTDIVILGSQAAGKMILIVAGARGVVHVFLAAGRRTKRALAPSAPKSVGARGARPTTLLRQCWELTRCRSSSGICPALRERRSCWKRGSGCHCDLNLAEKLATGVEAWAHEEVVAIQYRARQQRRPCKACPLYEEHQEYKFRIVQWLAYPITAALILITLPVLRFGYERGLQFMDRMVAALAFMPSHGLSGANPGGVQSMVLSSNVEWVFLGCLGLLLLSYVLQGIERAVFRWGW